MTSRDRVAAALNHRQPDRVPVDFGGATVTGMHVSCVAALRDHYGLEKHPVKIFDPGQMLGCIEDDLCDAMGIDTVPAAPPRTGYGFPFSDWKPWRMYDGLEILVPGGFNVTIADNGDTLLHPQGDLSAPPSGRMPNGGYFFDAIIRQPPIDEDKLDPQDNLEEYGVMSDADVEYYARTARAGSATGRAVVLKAGAGLGDIATIPGIALKHPKGIRDITEWYVATRTRRDYIHKMFEAQTAFLIENCAKINAAAGDAIDAIYLCGTDFGTQKSTFCSVDTFRELWLPYYQALTGWIHRNTQWKVFKHSCGAVEKFINLFIEAGFDILNPVQISAAGMDPAHLKQTYGDRIVFWGGGVDTQKVLPFAAPAGVREQVLRHCEIFAKGGGFIFNAVHNVQARTPVANIVAMIDAVHEFNGN